MGGVFTDRTLAGHVKEMVEERMIRALSEFSANKKLRKDASLHRQRALHRQTMEHGRLLAQARLQTTDPGVMPIDLSVDKNPIDNASSGAQRM
jgi:ATP-dependent RNA helicase SUPV3L1/SUV3